MLTRRHIRIKVLQALYGFSQTDDPNLALSLKELTKSLDRICELYLYELRIFIEIHKLAEERIEKNRKKFRPTDEDLKPNTKFIDNRVLRALASNSPLQKDFENHKIHWGEHRDILIKIYNDFRESENYARYMNSGDSSLKEDKQILKIFYAEFITKNETLHQLYEDFNMHWADDLDAAQMFVVKTFKSFQEVEGKMYSKLSMNAEREIESANDIPDGYDMSASKVTVDLYKDEDDAKFGALLLRHTANEAADHEKLIQSKTKNWDMDRIASIDILLMKMAISELKHFDQIPVKVTLNEYIDLSKEYSTPKSSQFINGILDKLVEQLKGEGLVVKVGRGLM